MIDRLFIGGPWHGKVHPVPEENDLFYVPKEIPPCSRLNHNAAIDPNEKMEVHLYTLTMFERNGKYYCAFVLSTLTIEKLNYIIYRAYPPGQLPPVTPVR